MCVFAKAIARTRDWSYQRMFCVKKGGIRATPHNMIYISQLCLNETMKYFRYANYFYLVLSFNGQDTGLSRQGSEFNSPWNRQLCGYGIMVVLRPSKPAMWVRFPLSTPILQQCNASYTSQQVRDHRLKSQVNSPQSGAMIQQYLPWVDHHNNFGNVEKGSVEWVGSYRFLMGYSQAVRHKVLILAFSGSNPDTSAMGRNPR